MMDIIAMPALPTARNFHHVLIDLSYVCTFLVLPSSFFPLQVLSQQAEIWANPVGPTE